MLVNHLLEDLLEHLDLKDEEFDDVVLEEEDIKDSKDVLCFLHPYALLFLEPSARVHIPSIDGQLVHHASEVFRKLEMDHRDGYVFVQRFWCDD